MTDAPTDGVDAERADIVDAKGVEETVMTEADWARTSKEAENTVRL